MFYRQESNQYINEGQAFSIDGVQYPANWLNLSTPEEKTALGLEEVVATNQPFDPRYYWTGETLNGAELTYTGIAKDLDDVKTSSISQIKQTTYAILQPTDYIDTRNLRDPSYKPEWMTWRESVLTTAATSTAAINAAEDVDGVATVVNDIVWPQDPNATNV